MSALYPEDLIPLIVLPSATFAQIREATCTACGEVSVEGHWCCAKMNGGKRIGAGIDEDDVFGIQGQYHAI